jgi:plastocyanin
LTGCASTGSVEGRVSMANRRGGVAETVITAAPDDTLRADREGLREAVLYQSRGRLFPAVLLIDPGTRVRFENRDKIFHNAFSVSPSGPFDLGSLAPGRSRSVRFDRAGIVQVYCEFHPKEGATIIIAPTHARTQAHGDGTYLMGGLSAGSYLVRAWHPDYGAKFRRVQVVARERVTVNFRY